MPRKLICVEPGKLEWQEYEPPALEPGQVRVQAEFAAAKHGTEMAFFKGYRPEARRTTSSSSEPPCETRGAERPVALP